jgi:hypothetical protein
VTGLHIFDNQWSCSVLVMIKEKALRGEVIVMELLVPNKKENR